MSTTQFAAQEATSRSRQSLQRSLARLENFAELEVDWDSYGGLPPSPQAIAGARDLIASVAAGFTSAGGERALPWTVAPLADGGVLIEWRGPCEAIEVDVDENGEFAYLLDRPTAPERFAEAEGVSGEEVRRLIGDVISDDPEG